MSDPSESNKRTTSSDKQPGGGYDPNESNIQRVGRRIKQEEQQGHAPHPPGQLEGFSDASGSAEIPSKSGPFSAGASHGPVGAGTYQPQHNQETKRTPPMGQVDPEGDDEAEGHPS